MGLPWREVELGQINQGVRLYMVGTAIEDGPLLMTPRNPVYLPPSVPRGQGQPLSSLISSYCNSSQHLSPPASDPRLAAVGHFRPVQIAQLGRGPFLPEEERRPPQAPRHLKRNQPEYHTQQASKGAATQQRTRY